MKSKTIILICGEAGVGKSTFAENLKAKLLEENYISHIEAFATGLKEEAKRQGWNGEKDEKGRKMLQDLDFLRVETPTIWTDALIQRVEDLDDDVEIVIIADWRYEREETEIRAKYENVIALGLEREFESPLTEEQQNHISENSLNDVQLDYAISLETLDDSIEVAALIAVELIKILKGENN